MGLVTVKSSDEKWNTHLWMGLVESHTPLTWPSHHFSSNWKIQQNTDTKKRFDGDHKVQCCIQRIVRMWHVAQFCFLHDFVPPLTSPVSCCCVCWFWWCTSCLEYCRIHSSSFRKINEVLNYITLLKFHTCLAQKPTNPTLNSKHYQLSCQLQKSLEIEGFCSSFKLIRTNNMVWIIKDFVSLVIQMHHVWCNALACYICGGWVVMKNLVDGWSWKIWWRVGCWRVMGKKDFLFPHPHVIKLFS